MTRALLAAASAVALLALGACGDQSAGNQTARAGIWAAGSTR